MSMPNETKAPLAENGSGESRPSGLRIRLLDRFSLSWRQQDLPLPQLTAACSLLAYLILHHGRSFSRDVLVGQFWPERTEAAARRALSNALWQIRRSLEPAADRLAADSDTIGFYLQENDWLDLNVFEQQVSAGRKILGQGQWPARELSDCLARLNEAAELYGRGFWPDCYDDWVLLERERRRESYLWALEQLVALYKHWGDERQALLWARRLVAADPLRESAHRELMRLYHVLDRDRAALEQYATLRRLLQDELGLEPMTSTAALYQEIRTSLEQAGPVHLPIPLPVTTPALDHLEHLPFVGRRRERAALLEALQAAAQGHSGVALIEGPPGIGKTRLLEEVVADARWRGFQVGLGKAAEMAAAAPYQPLQEALAPLLTPLRIAQLADLVEPRWLGAVGPLFEGLSEHLADLPRPVSRGPEQERRQLQEGLLHLLGGLAEVSPLLLVLEDLHASDGATLAALPPIISRLGAVRLFLVLSCRSAEARERGVVWETLKSIAQARPLLRLELDPFQAQEVVTVVRRSLGAGQTDDRAAALARSLQHQTGGNPLFMIEMLKYLLEQGLLPPSPGAGPILPSGEWSLPVPESIRELVGQRLLHLPPALRAVLDLAAVLGKEASFSSLSLASDIPSATLTERLLGLCQRSFMAESQTGYRFEHDLIREVVYQAIAPARRASLHRRAGAVLEQKHPERVQALAYHFDRGSVADKALAYTLQAGERAQAISDYPAACEHYERALVLAGEEPAARWEALSRQEHLLDLLGRRAAQEEIQAAMLSLAGALDDPLRRAHTRYRQGWRHVLAGEPTRALELLDEAGRLARQAGEYDLLGRTLASAARAWWRLGDASRCRGAIEEARQCFQKTGNRNGESRVLNMLGNFHLGLSGNYSQALLCFEENRRIEALLGNDHAVAAAQGNIGVTYCLLGQYERSQQTLAEVFEFMTLVGDRNSLATSCHCQGENHWALGNLAQARAMAEQALAICREINDHNFEIESIELLGRIALDRRELEQARRYFEQALYVTEANQQSIDWTIQQAYLALACLELGQLEEADRRSEQAIAKLEELGEPVSRSSDVYFARYQVLRVVAGESAARPYLEQAHQHLLDMANKIDDPELRHSFLEHVPLHRKIVTTYDSGRLPPTQVQVRLPRQDAPVGRPLQEDEFTTVTWTIHQAEDADIPDKVALRRHRLLRLLQEAAEQGAAPTIDDLAEALFVSTRTIKRDLAALRAEGCEASTRGQH
ncbi:MAG: AAA family ATPase [Chloroflexia bacterium]|nr:AAA family ATPase [Chloroflexia bacterium]